LATLKEGLSKEDSTILKELFTEWIERCNKKLAVEQKANSDNAKPIVAQPQPIK